MTSMEGRSSVVKCHPSLPTPRSVPSYTVHRKTEKHQMSLEEPYNAPPFVRSSQSGHLNRSTRKQEDTRDLLPANIRHKYGSSVVDQLISPQQVRRCLREEERTQYHQGYRLPRMNSCFLEDYPHKLYYELGYCLRSNLFPGAPIKQNSLVRDSYTAEVNERGRLEKRNTPHWYGRKTDDLAIWSEMLMKRKTIAKILQSQHKPSRGFPPPLRTNVPKDVPPPPPPPLPPPKKPRKQRQRAKSEKTEVQPAPVSAPKEDNDFWDFYDKPI
ncbi:ciliary microtubule inner protein 4 [Dendropsophus ebraccatus]|uniref:ciliary microtubule inner protein 4 n=1 Tax=Dendropsophus ebraccatus TaxID=150705 RepID=UPI00383104B8